MAFDRKQILNDLKCCSDHDLEMCEHCSRNEEDQFCMTRLCKEAHITIRSLLIEKERARADAGRDLISAIKKRASRHAYSSMVNGDMCVTYTISEEALEELVKLFAEGTK